jgi:hypothetical protein
MFANKNGIVRIESQSGDVDVGKMVGAKNVWRFRIQPGTGFHRERQKAYRKNQPGPPPVKNAHQLELLLENYGNQEQREEKQKGKGKHSEAVVEVDLSKNGFHGQQESNYFSLSAINLVNQPGLQLKSNVHYIAIPF